MIATILITLGIVFAFIVGLVAAYLWLEDAVKQGSWWK